ncbi:RHS repeat-associated core domain-containing protein [Candidatus Poribacteria bacterium]|nr:RHS repeat-associated core domain-containing protein [Candidatus Poribacteria bacterium]
MYNVVALTNAGGNVVERADYGDFGALALFDNNGGLRISSLTGNPFWWNGQRLDGESQLYHYRLRQLDPATGRFTTRDPIGMWGDWLNRGNGYSYTGNNPWSYVDPLGLAGEGRPGRGGITACPAQQAIRTESTYTTAPSAFYINPNTLEMETVGTISSYRPLEQAEADPWTVSRQRDNLERDLRRDAYSNPDFIRRRAQATGRTEEDVQKELNPFAKLEEQFRRQGHPEVPSLSPEQQARNREELARLAGDGKQAEGESTSDRGDFTPPAPYNRREHYGRTPKRSDRNALGAGTDQVVDHSPPLVQRYYEGDPLKGEPPGYLMTPQERQDSANDRSRMQLQSKEESNRQGAEMSRYSQKMRSGATCP